MTKTTPKDKYSISNKGTAFTIMFVALIVLLVMYLLLGFDAQASFVGAAFFATWIAALNIEVQKE